MAPGPAWRGVAGATLHDDHPLLARWQLAAARWLRTGTRHGPGGRRPLPMGGDEEGGESSADSAFLSSARAWLIRGGPGCAQRGQDTGMAADCRSEREISVAAAGLLVLAGWMDLSEASEERLRWTNGLRSVHYFHSF